MELRNLLGYEPYDYDFQGHKGTGVRLFCSVPKVQQSSRVVGQKMEIIKVSKDVFNQLGDVKLGCTLELYYNRFGKVDLVKLA